MNFQGFLSRNISKRKIHLNPAPFICTFVPPLIEPDVGVKDETENS